MHLENAWHVSERHVIYKVNSVCRSRGEKEKANNAQVQSKVSSKVVENIRQLPPVLLMDED